MRKIDVTYDGEYPNACSGTLTIKVNGVVVYANNYDCHSTGSVWFDGDWGEHIEDGELIWDKASQFEEDIQKAVRDVLGGVTVCCGGCV